MTVKITQAKYQDTVTGRYAKYTFSFVSEVRVYKSSCWGEITATFPEEFDPGLKIGTSLTEAELLVILRGPQQEGLDKSS